MTIEEKIGQLMIIGLKGPTLESSEAEFIVKNNIGGVILFSRNIESPEQVHRLCSELQSLRHKLPGQQPLFISIDMEGGRVARLKAPFTEWPPMALLGKTDSTTVAFRFGQAMAEELRSVGINLDFAPCVDILTNPKNAVIGDRALGDEPEIVGKLASAIVRGLIKGGVIACAKHFPGHGNTLLDSHEDLPIEEADLKRLESVELQPFKKAFRARLDLVMTAHIKFQAVDPEWPVTLSEIFLKKILREQLRYRDLVISDDLDMKALAKNYPREMIPVRALQAGCDILLYCNDPVSPGVALQSIRAALKDKLLDPAAIDASFRRVVELKKEKLSNPDPAPFSEVQSKIGHPDHLQLAKTIRGVSAP